jgi:type II secretory pathway pseudopilin PulG
MKTIEAVVVILIVSLGASFVLNYSLYASNQQLKSEFNSLNETGIASSMSASTTDEPLGLNLSMAMNTTLLQSGQGIDVIISEKNTLSTTNTVNTSDKWQLSSLSLGPCGTINYPMGLAIFKGYYASSNISTAEALKLYQPGTYMCPDILLDIISYTFQPISDMASVNAPYPNFNLSMVSSVTASGYWTGGLLGHTEFSNFSSGIYTVAGGDEWGQLILLHFVVI